jgi:hypothetical protein
MGGAKQRPPRSFIGTVFVLRSLNEQLLKRLVAKALTLTIEQRYLLLATSVTCTLST